MYRMLYTGGRDEGGAESVRESGGNSRLQFLRGRGGCLLGLAVVLLDGCCSWPDLLPAAFDRFKSLDAIVRLKIARGEGAWSMQGVLGELLSSILTKTRINSR